MAANAAFAQKYRLPFPLLSDAAGEVCRAYGACDDLASGMVRRNTYIIGQGGTILRLFRNVNPKDQAEVVLAFLRDFSNQAYQESVLGDYMTPYMTPQVKIYKDSIDMHDEKEENMEDMRNDAHVDQITDTLQPENTELVAPSQVQPAQNSPSLVFALGKLSYDFGSEARRDSLMQHMGNSNLLDYLEQNPSQAAAIIWTLNLDATPIYAIQPQGAFASEVYNLLRQFLKEQAEQGVERVSIPGVIIGQVRLMSGQTVPVIGPEPRCMYSWTTAALVEAVIGTPPQKSAKTDKKEEYTQKRDVIANFLERVYHELRNLGITSQERAMNYAVANIANAKNIFEAALKKKLELHNIDVVASPICRPSSDCWDVKLIFFDPENVLRAKSVHRFTIDVSDVCPVMVGQVRSWSMP